MITRMQFDQSAAPVDANDRSIDQPPETTRPKPRTTRRVVALLATAALAGAGLVIAGVAPRAGREAELATDVKAVADARRS